MLLALKSVAKHLSLSCEGSPIEEFESTEEVTCIILDLC